MEKFNTVLSLLAFCLAGYTYWKHERKIKKQEELLNQYELEKIELEKVESKRAIVEANVIKGLKGKRTIKVYNKGKAIAKSVMISLPEDGRFYVLDNPCPIDNRPQHGIDISVIVYEGSTEKILINFEWKDEFQEKNTDSQMLQL